MAERPAPSVRARRLARELRRLREATELTGEAAATQLGWSSAKVSRLETARTPITVSDLRKLLDLYGASDTEADRLVDLARTSRERGWWENYVVGVPAEWGTYIGLEADASSISSFTAILVPGLLQTEDYAREMLKSLLLMPPREVERLVEARRKRQDRIYRADKAPLMLHAIIDESALRRQIGGPDVLRDQLRHLVSTDAELHNVELQVLPYSAGGGHSAIDGTFTILNFPRDPEIVTLEHLDSHLFIEGEKAVYRYTLVFNELVNKALSPAESVVFINQVIANL